MIGRGFEGRVKRLERRTGTGSRCSWCLLLVTNWANEDAEGKSAFQLAVFEWPGRPGSGRMAYQVTFKSRENCERAAAAFIRENEQRLRLDDCSILFWEHPQYLAPDDLRRIFAEEPEGLDARCMFAGR